MEVVEDPDDQLGNPVRVFRIPGSLRSKRTKVVVVGILPHELVVVLLPHELVVVLLPLVLFRLPRKQILRW